MLAIERTTTPANATPIASLSGAWRGHRLVALLCASLKRCAHHESHVCAPAHATARSKASQTRHLLFNRNAVGFSLYTGLRLSHVAAMRIERYS